MIILQKYIVTSDIFLANHIDSLVETRLLMEDNCLIKRNITIDL